MNYFTLITEYIKIKTWKNLRMNLMKIQEQQKLLETSNQKIMISTSKPLTFVRREFGQKSMTTKLRVSKSYCLHLDTDIGSIETIDLGSDVLYDWNSKAAKRYIEVLMELYNIEYSPIFTKHGNGFCDLYARKLILPVNFDNPYNIIICLHEISHIILLDERENLRYVNEHTMEYLTELHTLKLAKGCGLFHKSYIKDLIEEYTYHAKEYVFDKLVDDLKRGDATINNIRKDILKWIGINNRKALLSVFD